MSQTALSARSSGHRILHLITGLEVGGAETMLVKLLPHLNRSGFDQLVAPLIDDGELGAALRAQGVPVLPLGMRRGLPDPRGLTRLMALIRRERPALLQTWMYHADLLGSIATRLGPPVPVIWGIRRSALDPLLLKPATYAAGKLCAAVSGWLPAHIVCCSETALAGHVQKGYCRARMSVIPNGFDADRFRPDPGARAELRAELGLKADAVLIGLAGRFDPQKDHRTFIRAAGILAPQRAGTHFVLCGSGIDRDNRDLARWLKAAGCAERVQLLGLRRDMPRIIAALDIAVSSSISEGFPNVIGEAMACALPCVVTDVGDSARIVADTGWAVPPADPAALAAAVGEVLGLSAEERADRGRQARQRIAEHYSLDAVAARYGALYRSVLETASRS